MSNNPSNNSNMGDLFRQRRAAAASSSSSSTRLTPITSSNIPSSGFGGQPAVSQAPPPTSSGRKSFAEIQREQEIAQQHQKQQRQQPQQSTTQQQRQQYNVAQRQSVDEYGRLVRPSAAGDRGSSNSSYSRGDPRSYDGPRAGGGGGDRYSSSGGGSNRRGTNNSIHNSRDSHRSSLPTEQGIIHTLLDKFGFIRCADRPIEVFFHYSEYKEGHSDDLNIGDEVEFKIGKAEDRNRRTGDEKLSAFDISKLPEGTIYWEKEDEPVGKRWRGVIDQSAREQRSSGGGPGRNSSRNGPSSAAVDGVIRIVNDDDNEENSSGMDQLEIYYTASDYTPTKNSSTGRITGQSRLDRKDIVEFTLVTERRTGKKYARSITLVQSERERQRIEQEAKLLANAKLEEGKVVIITRDFGFIQSSSRLEQVYFHESNILPVDNDENENGTSSIDMLKEGQDVQFYVIGNEGGKNGKSVSARKIKILPKGSVKFEHMLAQGVTGLVVECPLQAVVGFDRDRRGGGKSQQTIMGKIRLHNEIVGKTGGGGEEDEQVVITEVLLHPDMYPGGTFAVSRTGSEVGCWIRPGDGLLFDVVQKVIDGSCHAMPTKSIQRRSSDADDDESTSVKGGVASEHTNNTTNKPCIHLIETTLCGRAQGIVRTIHDNNYGFIQLVERGVDAYFPLYEVFPSDIQADLARDNPALYHSDDLNNLIQSKGGRINIEVGMEVEFDLSLQMSTQAGGVGGGGGRYKQQNSRGPVQGKESLRGRRIQILPKGSVKEKITVASEVKATVIKSGDTKHQYVGTIQLEESLKVDTVSKCHPLVARLLDGIIQGRYGSEDVVFHDAISERDAQIVITMVNANDDLEWSYIDEKSATDGHSRKLCIKKKHINSELENLTLEAVDASATSDDAGEAGNDETNEVIITSPERKKQTHKSRKGSKKTKVVKTLRFEKYSFPDITIDPLNVGDVLTCDIFQSRKSGSFLVENINVIERKERPVVVSESKGKSLGFVSEVVPSRHFGFITVVNAEGTKGDHVFFHFRDVDQSNKSGRKDVVMRGNEVQFDAAPGKNGKTCATNITFLPQGTLKLPVKANNNSPSCTGYILIEPSHTSLVNTPSHAPTMQNGPAAASAGGRWANVKDDKSANVSGSNVNEGGVILLLSDPSNLFTPKPPVVTDKDSAEGKETNDECDKPAGTESNPTDSETTKPDTKDVEQSALAGPTHIRYKLSSLAPRGLSNGRSDPKRGDLVTFSKARGANLVKDIRVEKTTAAISVKGGLTDIDMKNDTAVLVTSLENNETKKYDISLSEVVSCEKTLLKDQEQCDGILYEGKIYGVCRTKDIHLASSFGGSSGGLKERPRLNLTVKKELGGQVMAQSKMAKGPDNTNGFVEGWTKRVSHHVVEEEEDSNSLSIAAMEFVPTEILTSGFQSTFNKGRDKS